jgi:hypothetical protein
MSYPVIMTDNTVFYLGSYYFPKEGMKKNHERRKSKSGIEYIVNLFNERCYLILQ